jgi:hypothetical protein
VSLGDTLNLDDLTEVIDALIEAQIALAIAVERGGQAERGQFISKVGFARRRLSRICDRIQPASEGTDAP